MNPDAIFWIASMTKPVTGVAAMMMVEEAKLDLDAPVAHYLPALEHASRERSNRPSNRRDANFMLAQLVPQKAPDGPYVICFATRPASYIRPNIRAPGFGAYTAPKSCSPETRLWRNSSLSLGKLPLAHQPGEVWGSSWGVDVLARVAEIASGQPFDQFPARPHLRPTACDRHRLLRAGSEARSSR
jgi:CubicO group peptidase (beta-lactamase class C family)